MVCAATMRWSENLIKVVTVRNGGSLVQGPQVMDLIVYEHPFIMHDIVLTLIGK